MLSPPFLFLFGHDMQDVNSPTRACTWEPPPGSSVHGIFQARVLEWGATAFSEIRRERGIKDYPDVLT